MTDDGAITNRILLDHIMVNTGAIDRLSKRVDGLSQRIDKLEVKVEEGFKEARNDRQNLHEDLDATIRLQFRQQKQLAAIGAGPDPEEYE